MSDFEHRHAAHCESGTVASLLRHQGLDLSEPMVFGIGGGLFFLHLSFVKMGGIPLTSYRDAPRILIKNMEKRLGVRWRQQRFRSAESAMRSLDGFLAQGQPVGLQTASIGCRIFPSTCAPFQRPQHYCLWQAGRRLSGQRPGNRNGQTCRAGSARARFAKGPFAPRGLAYYPEHVPANPDLKAAARDAIRQTARRMTGLPVPFFGVRGIRSLANKLERWPDKLGSEQARAQVSSVVRMQEEIGTGGAGFRFMYAAFLQEAADLLKTPALAESARDLTATGDRWRDFAVQGAQLVKNKQDDSATYAKLAAMLRECADREQEIFTRLKSIV
jgi:hypothetical protein